MASLKTVLMSAIDSIVKIVPAKERSGTLLLIRMDEIGDYVIFRNFLELLRKSNKYRDYRITLLGNKIFQELAENLDINYIDEFIWVDKRRFLKEYFYRFKIMLEIRKGGYSTVIAPTYSRRYLIDDAVVKVSRARHRIGHIGDSANIKQHKKNQTDKFYTSLIGIHSNHFFEFYRNKHFFELLLNDTIDIDKPFIKLSKAKKEIVIKNKYSVLFPGAGEHFRQWNADDFAKIANYLSLKYDLDIVIAGGVYDKPIAKKIMTQLDSPRIIDLTGKTTLCELVELLSGATILISNDTSAIHLAAAVNTKTICISNGNFYGRFVPYPRETFSHQICIFPEEITNNKLDFDMLNEKYRYGSRLNINQIKVENVTKAVDELLMF